MLKRDGDMILYGCPATGTVSLTVPSLVRLPYTWMGDRLANIDL